MGFKAASLLVARHPFISGADAETVAEYSASIPSHGYDKSPTFRIDDLDPEQTCEMWNGATSALPEFEFAILRNFTGVDIFYDMTVDGGTVNEHISRSRLLAGTDTEEDGVQANASELGAFSNTISGRVTRIVIYNPSEADIAGAEIFIFGEREA